MSTLQLHIHSTNFIYASRTQVVHLIPAKRQRKENLLILVSVWHGVKRINHFCHLVLAPTNKTQKTHYHTAN